MYYFDREKMEKIMRKKNINQITLARKMAVTHAAVGKWGKDGYGMKMSHFERLTSVLECSPNALCSKL